VANGVLTINEFFRGFPRVPWLKDFFAVEKLIACNASSNILAGEGRDSDSLGMSRSRSHRRQPPLGMNRAPFRAEEILAARCLHFQVGKLSPARFYVASISAAQLVAPIDIPACSAQPARLTRDPLRTEPVGWRAKILKKIGRGLRGYSARQRST